MEVLRKSMKMSFKTVDNPDQKPIFPAYVYISALRQAVMYVMDTDTTNESK